MKLRGFEYYLDDEIIKRYQEKSPELRLKWLYFGALLRKQYPKEIVQLQDKFRDNFSMRKPIIWKIGDKNAKIK